MTNTPKKITSLLACCVFALTTLQARVSFNPNTDILIAQFDGRPDADDIHSQAALGSMLLHPDFAGVEVYAVMGAVGTQGGTFIDSTNLFNQIYGPEGTDTWTDAHADWTTSVTRIKNKARAVLDAGGHVWVQEAGQSDITADWVQGLIDDGVSETLIKSNVTVVQHSNWNEDKTTDADLEFVQNTTDYVKIADGNSGGNGTPDYHLDDTAFMNEIFAGEAPPKTEALWLLADQIIKDSGFNPSWSSIPDGGVDFSDEVETWWIFELGTHADTVRKFWDWYVVDPAVEAFVEQNGIVAFETESVNPTTPEWQEATLIAGFSGDSYFIAQEENLNQGGEGVVSYPVYITTTGRYQLNWRSRIGIGSDNTEHNDNFARVVDADGNPVTPVVNDNDATGTWYKAYMNRANAWDWQTSNKDNDPHSLSWNLQADTLYYFQISARSNGHAVDRVALWDHNRHNLANKTTGKNPNNGDFDNLINSATSVVGGLKKIAYIHGDIAADGTVPSGPDDPFHQMLLTDTGRRGLSIFKAMVEAEGHTIEQFYDQDTTLDAAFLDQFDAIIFSLHQKIWSSAEKAALNTWLQAGGGMLIYSDSASGGLFSIVGAQNTVGQTVTNNLISQYGMEVTVDQADGVKAIQAGPGATHPIVFDRPVLEGEGVSPVAVDPTSQAVRLIPYKNNPDFVVSGTPTINKTQNITIQNPQYAALALAPVGDGNIIAMFDRQPMWNNGEGSDIEERDNEEILRRIVNFLVGVEALNSPPTVGAGSDQTLFLPDDSVNLDGSASDPEGASLTTAWTKISGPGTVTFGDASAVDTTATFGASGTYVLRLTGDDGEATAFDEVTITVVPDQGNVVTAINSGGDAYTAADGVFYSADTISGGNTFDTDDPISGTADDPIYQSERWGLFTYEVSVPDGTYDVLLQFAEIFQTSDGNRVFDMLVEGNLAANNLDIHALVGHDAAHDILVSGVAVSDGSLTITSVDAGVNNPKLSGFRILSAEVDEDTDGDGIADFWEIEHFGNLTGTNGAIDSDQNGVADFFEYLGDADPNDPSETGLILAAGLSGAGNLMTLSWKIKEGFEIGTDYKAEVSTNLSQWNPLPPEHYDLNETTTAGRTAVDMTLTHDYGNTVFTRLTSP